MEPSNWVVIPLQTYNFAIHTDRLRKPLPERLLITPINDLSIYVEEMMQKNTDLFIVAKHPKDDVLQLKAWTKAVGNTYLKFLYEYAPIMDLDTLYMDEFLPKTPSLRQVVFATPSKDCPWQYDLVTTPLPTDVCWYSFDMDDCLSEQDMLVYAEKDVIGGLPGSLHTLILATQASVDPTDPNWVGLWINPQDIPFHARKKSNNERSPDNP